MQKQDANSTSKTTLHASFAKGHSRGSSRPSILDEYEAEAMVVSPTPPSSTVSITLDAEPCCTEAAVGGAARSVAPGCPRFITSPPVSKSAGAIIVSRGKATIAWPQAHGFPSLIGLWSQAHWSCGDDSQVVASASTLYPQRSGRHAGSSSGRKCGITNSVSESLGPQKNERTSFLTLCIAQAAQSPAAASIRITIGRKKERREERGEREISRKIGDKTMT